METSFRLLVRPNNGTFFKLPIIDPDQHYDVMFLGIPSNFGALSKRSTAGLGVSALRSSSQIFPLRYSIQNKEQGWYDYVSQEILLQGKKMCDVGDLLIQNFEAEKAMNELPLLINKLCSMCELLLIVGGDHSVSYWTSKGIEPMNVIFFDAHEDAGNILSTYPHHANVVSYLDLNPNITAIVQYGLRGIIPNERNGQPEKRKIVIDDMQFKSVLSKLGNDSTMLSIDWDVIDPSLLPSVSSPMPDGWSFKDLVNKISIIRKTGLKLKIAEFVEFSPSPGDVPTESVSLVFMLLRIAHILTIKHEMEVKNS